MNEIHRDRSSFRQGPKIPLVGPLVIHLQILKHLALLPLRKQKFLSAARHLVATDLQCSQLLIDFDEEVELCIYDFVTYFVNMVVQVENTDCVTL